MGVRRTANKAGINADVEPNIEDNIQVVINAFVHMFLLRQYLGKSRQF